MQTARRHVLGLALIFSVTLGAPMALSGVEAPRAKAALTLFVDDAAAQTADCPATGGAARGGDASGSGTGIVGGSGAPGGPAFTTCVQFTAGAGGDANSPSGDGGRGGNGNGGLAILHNSLTTSATSETSVSLEDVSTGDIHNEVTIIVEPTDETVVINMAGNPGSNGIHVMNVGAPVHSINTGGITSSADASGIGGDGGNSGDTNSSGGDGGDAVETLPPLTPLIPLP